jgi:RND family efflux transporter MFP subunit
MRSLFAVFLLSSTVSVWAAPAYTVKPLSDIAVYPEFRAAVQVVPNNESRLAAEVSARIEAMPARVGQSVKKGDVLVRLDARQFQLARDQAASQVELLANRYKLAELQFEQAKALNAQQYVSSQLLEQRRSEMAVTGSELKIARTGLAQADLALDKTRLRAPFAGAVKERLAGEGELAAPGMPLLVLTEVGRNEVRAQIASSQIAQLQAAPKLHIRQGDQRFAANIIRITPVVDARAQTREVVLAAQTPLLPGSSGELTWSSTIAHLPAAYLQQRQGRFGAWVEEGGKLVFKLLPKAQAGRPLAVQWPLSTRVVDQGRFAVVAK